MFGGLALVIWFDPPSRELLVHGNAAPYMSAYFHVPEPAQSVRVRQPAVPDRKIPTCEREDWVLVPVAAYQWACPPIQEGP